MQASIVVALLFMASYTDITKRLIPDILWVLLALAGLINFEPANIFGIFAALPLFVAAYINNGFGGGDVKLMAALGMVLGFANGIAVLIIALAAQLVFYFFYSLVQKYKHQCKVKSLPFAPFILFSTLTIYFMNIGGLSL